MKHVKHHTDNFKMQPSPFGDVFAVPSLLETIRETFKFS